MLSGRGVMRRRKVLVLIIVMVLLLVALGVGGWTYHEQPRFCGDLCHIMDPYLESWNGSDYGASAHAAEGVTCLDCHEPTIQEQMNELLTFVKGDYTVPLEQLEVSDEFCYDCHLLDEHENKEQVVERTAELEENPHDSHLVGEIGCATCHNMHKPSEDQCAVCHDEITTGAGWTAEVTRTDEIQVWDPEMDCTACKSMIRYVGSLEDPAFMGYAHAEEGLDCMDCHEQGATKQVHEEALPTRRMRAREFGDDYCFDCHVENEHTSYEEIIQRTADYFTEAGLSVNPHDPHPEGLLTEGQLEKIVCSRCHQNHEDTPPIEGCYAGCHHKGSNLDRCSECHEESDVHL